jgi:hypothetical protein
MGSGNVAGGKLASAGMTMQGGNVGGEPSGGGARRGDEPSSGGSGIGGSSSETNGGSESSGGSETAGGAGTVGGGAETGGQADESGGQPGGAGQPDPPAAGAACLSCGAGKCDVLKSCEQNPECSPWLACVKACDSETCTSTCDATYNDVARVYYGVYSCLCTACAAECAVADSCRKKCVDDGTLPPSATEPDTLAETGLYAGAQLAPYVRLFEPKYALWADGAGKERYIYVPRCATIDTADMDHWQFPVGTRLWKHFAVDGKRVETRMLQRFGSGNTDWLYATYDWDESKPDDPSAAVAVLHGLPNANGTLHDIPDPSACPACHGKLPDKPLGFGAVQLSHAGEGLTMQKLSDWGWLSVPARNGFPIPGTAVQQAALGYLHANCGGCHNSFGEIPRENPMKLRLLVAQTAYAQTDTVLTTIGVPTINAYPELHDKPRIDPQAPSNSAIYLRMSDRNEFPMPPLATKFPDTDGGVAAVTAWIDSIPKQ